MVEWLKQNDVLPLTQVTLFDAERESKVFVNGSWIGVHKMPFDLCKKFNVYKRNGIIPVLSTISFNIKDNTIDVFCDSGGRLLRPIYHVSSDNKPSYSDLITSDKFKKINWIGLVCGTSFTERKTSINYSKILKVNDVFESLKTSIDDMEKTEGIVEYIDSSVLNTSLINTYDFKFSKKIHIWKFTPL